MPSPLPALPEHDELPLNPARAENESPADALRRRAGESKHGTRLRGVVLVANLLGALLFALLFALVLAHT